jgi:hypothetical protein
MSPELLRGNLRAGIKLVHRGGILLIECICIGGRIVAAETTHLTWTFVKRNPETPFAREKLLNVIRLISFPSGRHCSCSAHAFVCVKCAQAGGCAFH